MKRLIAAVLSATLAFSAIGTVALKSRADVVAEAEIDVSHLKASELLDMDGLVGWATVEGDGVETVTGGGNVTPVLATDYETLSALAKDNYPRVIIISGTIDTVGKCVNVGSNKTIMGIDENATVIGGFVVKNACNVIISNLNIKGAWPATALPDALGIEHSHHVWTDHLNIWDAPDGNLDIKGSSDYITVSWCKFWYSTELNEHRLSNLVSSGTGNDATELHNLNVTYHHNWFADLIQQRMPRLLYGKGHIYNNYYTAKNIIVSGNIEGRDNYCIGVGCYASALIENNYFKDSHNPHQIMYQGIAPARITARGNTYDNTTGKKQSGYFKGGSSYTAMDPEVFDNPPYTYYPDKATDIPAIVQAYVGPQNVLEENTDKPELAPAVTPCPENTEDNTKEPIVIPTNSPGVNDNPVTYDENEQVYTYNGTNSDGSNGKLDIKNPFAGMDLSEELQKDEDGHTVWNNGVTISYWIKLTEEITDIPVLNFNRADKREIGMSEKDMYEMCKEAESGTGAYKLGTIYEYYTMSGRKISALKGQGRYCRYNPNFPKSDIYKIDANGDIAVYEEGADLTKPESFVMVTAYEDGFYPYYGLRFDEEGGEESILPEAYIDGSLSLYASGSVGYATDSGTGIQMNPNLDDYGEKVGIDGNNYFRYWGNGSLYSYKQGKTVPTMAEKSEWHFVVAVIKNDWIQLYMDGIKIDSDYLNVAGRKMYAGVAGNSFNKGFGSSIAYVSDSPDNSKAYGDSILDFISDEGTTLSIGGTGLASEKLRQSTFGENAGAQIKDVRFYSVPLADENIGAERVQTFTKGWKLEGTELVEIEADSEPVPTPEPTAIPDTTDIPTEVPTETPAPAYELGDVDFSGVIDASDALAVLKHAAKIDELNTEATQLADVEKDGNIDAADALKILKYAARLINNL